MTIDLAHQAYGDRGAAVVILHGLLGSARNWTTIAKRLGETHRVFTLDLRNHGASPWADSMTYDDMVEDVRTFVEQRRLEPVHLVGHSMGGKVAMRLALLYHDLVDRLVVVDIAPVAYDHSFEDYIEAMRNVDLTGTSRRADIDERLAGMIEEVGVRQFLLQNLARGERGFTWRPNLDALAMHMDDLLGFPEGGARRFDGPTLFVAGERSHYVGAEHRAAIGRLFPNANVMTLKGAGHWVHAERPEPFVETAARFFAAG